MAKEISKLINFTYWGIAIGKPRMTRRDKRPPARPCVQRYWNFKADILSQAPKLPKRPYKLNFTAYLPIPNSWSKKKKEVYAGNIHQQTPDLDNILKALGDSLFDEDKTIAMGMIGKRWDDGKGPRIEISVR